MRLDSLELHPKGYLKLKEPLKIFINDSISQENFDTLLQALINRKSALPITGKHIHSKDGDYWSYFLNMPAFSVHLGETDSNRGNLACHRFINGDNGINKQYNNPFSQMFLLEPSKGIYLIYHRQPYYVAGTEHALHAPSGAAVTESLDWSMQDTYHELLERMHSFYEEGDAYIRSPRVSERMDENVLRCFDQYTAKEHDYETRQVDFTNGILYTRREVGADAKGSKITYVFYSQDENADPEKCLLSVGNKLVIYHKDEAPTGRTGLLTDIDYESGDEVRFTLEFYGQFNDADLPQEGYLFVHQNDTQFKIRRAVSKSIRGGQTPANFMYKTFHDFSTKGYEEPITGGRADLVSFLHGQMQRRFPPNQMQLEAIVKGILTEDVLLVLGPPGTGKTTVILAWVEYFLKQGKRVLISSQNNAAVDNVLERFKGKGEIIRLGREEKVQESCKEFLPSNRIELMRRSCKENGDRLKEQLTVEREQIRVYCSALSALMQYYQRYRELFAAFEPHRVQLNSIIENITKQHDLWEMEKKRHATTLSLNQRYQLFIDTVRRKPWIVRIWYLGKVWRTKRKLKKGQEMFAKYKRSIDYLERAYNAAVYSLKKEIVALREQNIFSELQQTKRQMLYLNNRIFVGSADELPLIPTFNSELRTLPCLQNRPAFSSDMMKNLPLCRDEIACMQEVDTAAQKLQEASRQWVAAALGDERNEIFEDILLEVCQVVGATCIGINSNKKFAHVDFDVTVIDESGQIQLHNALVPMSRSPKTLMLGDYKQIPPIVNDEIAQACRLDDVPTHLFEQSFFEFLFEKMREREIERLSNTTSKWLDISEEEIADLSATEKRLKARDQLLKPIVPEYIGTPIEEEYINDDGEEETQYFSRYDHDEIAELVSRLIDDPKKIVNLNSQFRMPGNISDVISEWFYENNYFSSYSMKNFAPVVPHTSLPMVLINTAGIKCRYESQPPSKMGYQNDYEAKIVGDIMEAILRPMTEEQRLEYQENLGSHLGVISAYGAQVRRIREELKTHAGVEFTNVQANTAVASLDSFQGQERDLIIYSLTRSSRTKKVTDARVGFLKELRRLNVAFTRCKKQLVIIGDLDYLKECLYVAQDTEKESLPCAADTDDIITAEQIEQCAACPVECERRFARFFRLLMQHVQAESPAGNLFAADEFCKRLKGEDNDGQ